MNARGTTAELDDSLEAPTERSAAIARRWGAFAALFAAGVGVFFLALWFSGSPAATAFAASRCKTNSALGLAVAGFGSWLLHGRWQRRAAVAAALLGFSALIGTLTLFEYLSGFDLGIDQLLASDVSSEELRFPNRISPAAAAGFVLLAAASWLITRPSKVAVQTGQVLAYLVLAVSSAALVGYLYAASILYRPLPFLRLSPYTAVGLISLVVATLSLRPQIWPLRAFSSPSIGGFLARRLLPITVLFPVVAGWLLLDDSQGSWLSPADRHALLVTSIALAMAPTVLLLAWFLDRIERRRFEAEDFLRRSSDLTSALSRARSVSEVTDAALDFGLPALGAQAGAFLVLTAGGRRLEVLGLRGYDERAVQEFQSFSVDADLPAARAVRERRALFLASTRERDQRFPELVRFSENNGWAALPLEGNSGALGAVALSFRQGQSFDEGTRERALRLAWQCAQALERALLFDSERKARENAEAASRAKDEFLAMLGHELRNPLSPILTSLHLMELRDPTGTVREREVIQRQVSHMVRLVDDLLDVSRIASGRIELRRQPLEIDRVLQRALELTTPLIRQKRHELAFDVAPHLVVDGDQERLVQVFSNLLTNAAKYTGDGGRIAVSARREDEQIVISVSDNGMGISADLLPHVFDLFVQGKRTLARSEGGLGLGLSLVRSLVELHGGRVSAASSGQGHGSELLVRLPRVNGSPVVSEDAAALRPASTAKTQRILLVDDNQDAVDSMARALTEAGHEVRVAYDGPSALHLVGQFAPRLALLDIGLPLMDGYELARRLRAIGGSSLVLVALTGYGQKSDRDRSAGAGFDRHWVKPISIGELTTFLAELG